MEPIKAIEKICSTCKYSYKGDNWSKPSWIQCRKNPPVYGGDDDYNCFPIAEDDTWCGEHVTNPKLLGGFKC
jgi:hypothetical protein